jgi:hypothetical protein
VAAITARCLDVTSTRKMTAVIYLCFHQQVNKKYLEIKTEENFRKERNEITYMTSEPVSKKARFWLDVHGSSKDPTCHGVDRQLCPYWP